MRHVAEPPRPIAPGRDARIVDAEIGIAGDADAEARADQAFDRLAIDLVLNDFRQVARRTMQRSTPG